VRDGTSKLLTLWDSSKIVDETGEGASEQASPPLIGTPHHPGKQPSTSSQKISSDSVPPSQITIKTLSKKVHELFALLNCSLIFFYDF
jgi:hypothetical protein